MKSFLVIGLGGYGFYIAKTLGGYNYDVMAVDDNEEFVNNALPFVTDGLIGDATDEKFLKSLGVTHFDTVFLNYGNDLAKSLVICFRLRELGAKHIVARATSEIHEKLLRNNGANDVIYPNRDVAQRTALRYSKGNLYDLYSLSETFDMIVVDPPEDWVGKTPKEMKIRKEQRVMVFAMRKDDEVISLMDGKTTIEAGVPVMAIGERADLQACFDLNENYAKKKENKAYH